MASLRAIREIHVQHTSEGADKVRRELDQQAASNERLAKSSENVATVTETSARRQQSAAGAYDRLRSSMDLTYRAQQQFERGQRTLDRAFEQGIVDARQYSRDLEMLRSRQMAVGSANDNMVGGLSRVAAMMGRLAPLMGALGVGLGGMGGLAMLGDSSRRMEEAERAARRLEGVLESTGAAAGLSAREIAGFADGIEEQTGRAAEEVMAVAAQLATFTSIGRDEFQRTILVANDMAEVFGGSLQSSLDAVARALDDPIKGFQNLRQRGFALEEQELNLVKAFQAVGDTAAAQNVVLQNLEKQVGGASARAFDGLTKAQADATKQTEDAIDAFNRVSGAHEARIQTTRAFGAAMAFAGENMGTIVPVAGTLTALVGARLATSFLTSTAASNAFGASLTALTTRAGAASAAMSILGGPVGIGVTTVTAIGAAILMWARNGDEANRSLSEHEGIVAQIRDRYREADEARQQIGRRDLEIDASNLRDIAASQSAALGGATEALTNALETQLYQLERSAAPGAKAIFDLAQAYLAGSSSAEQFNTELLTLGRTNEDVARILDEIERRGFNFDELSASAAGLEEELAGTNAQLENTTSRINDVDSAAASAANAMASFASNLATIREFDPVFTRQAKVQEDLSTITTQHAEAVRNLDAAFANAADMGEYSAQLAELEAGTRASVDAVSGLTDARARLAEYETTARIGAMDGRAAALARENQGYEAQRKALIDAGTAAGDLLGIADELARLDAARALRIADVNKKFDEQDASARKAAAGQRTAKQAGDEQIDTLQRQIDALGQSEGAAAAAEFRARELARALLEVRQAGGDVIPQGVRDDIDDAAGQIGVLTDRLARLRATTELERGQSETQRQIDLETRLIGVSGEARAIAVAGLEAENELRRQNISSTDAWGAAYVRNAQHMAAARGEIDRQTAAYEKQRDILSNVASTFLDIFTDTSSDSFFDRVMKGLADIGRQFAELGKQKLLENLTGGALGYTTGQPAPGQRSVAQPGLSGGIVQAANQNLPSSAFIPTPTAAVRQTTQRLAEGVTTSVSRNLLSNMLSAGKSQSHISGLNQEFAVALTNMFSEAPAAVRSATNIYSGFRSVERQAELFRNAVSKYGSEQAARKWVAPPGNSQHNRGMAADLSYGNSTARQWIHANAGRYGLAFPLGHENWHIELAGARGGGARSAVQAVSSVQAGIGGSFAIPQMPVYAAPQMSSAAQQAMAGGWSGFGPVPGFTGSSQVGWFGQGGKLQNFMQSPTGMGAMNALGAFGAGQQGGMLSGAMTGGLGAIGMGLPGPLALLGVGAGLLGGLFGGRQKRKQEHQQRAEAWAAQAQEWQAYQDEVRTGVGPTSGLRASQEAMANRLTGFVQTGSAAWKMGSNNSSALFSQVGAELAEYFARTNAEFGRAYEAQIASLNAGQGLSGPFISARDEILEAGKTLATFVDDTRVVFGDGSVEAQRAAEASIAQLRALLTGGQELSDIAAAVEQMRGAAAGLHTQLEVLGVSAADAGAAVSQDLAAAMNRLRSDFTRGIQDQIDDLDGKGYITEFRQFFTDIDGAIQDALLVGADRGLVDELFVRQAQSMVDGAQLSGEAFNELLSVFPRLSGVVREFSAAAEEATKRTADQIAALKLSYDDRFFETTIDTSTEAGALARFDRYAAREREEEIKAGGDAILELERALAAERGQIVKQFADRAIEEQKRALESAKSFLDGFTRDIGSYLDGLRAGPDSPLTGQARVDEARAQFDKQYALAMTGDRDALSSITGYADRLLEADRAYNTSSPAFQATFDQVTKALENLPKLLKPEDLLDKAIRETALDTQEAIRQATIDLAGRISTDFDKLDANLDGLLSLDELKAAGLATDAELKRIYAEIDLNGDNQISRLEGLLASDGLTRSTLVAAFGQGPAQTAGALAPHFARLDTSVNGLLDFNEMRAALGGIATDAQIRQMMTVLDENGDGQISRLELLNASSRTQIGSLTEMQRLTQLVWQVGTNSAVYQERTRHFTEVNSQLLQSIATTLANSLSMQERIRANLAAANGMTGARQFMTGGYTGGSSPTEVRGLVHGMEGVLTAQAMKGVGIPALDFMNRERRLPTIAMPVAVQAGNDNGGSALLTEVKALREEVRQLREENNAVTVQAAERVARPVEKMTGATEKGVRETRRARRTA